MAAFKDWRQEQRAQLIQWFRAEVDLQIWINDAVTKIQDTGGELHGSLVDLAFINAVEIDRLREQLDWLDTAPVREIYSKWIQQR